MASITIMREDCISCTNCWTTCPDIFEEDPADGKSRLHEEFRTGTELGKGVVPDEHLACTQEAAAACPVQIISVED